MHVTDIDEPTYLGTAQKLGVCLPIEQTPVWAAYEATVPGKTPWGYLSFERDGEPVAVMSLVDYQTHGYHFLRAHHGPVWAFKPSDDDERELLCALKAHVRKRDPKVLFCRLGVLHDLDCCRPTLSTLPYDSTVVVDLAGGDDQILARMKARGRRDVRKALRESPITCRDESAQGAKDFSEYYAVMTETGERDGFTPAPQTDFEAMLRILGPEHARLYAGRLDDGTLACWAIDTISGPEAVHYYAAMRTDQMRNFVVDKLIYFEMCDLARLGCTSFDLMAVGSDFQPALRGLNTFKCKFANDIVPVAPDRDLPVNGPAYALLTGIKDVRGRIRERAEKRRAKGPADPREDILPVVLGGDIGSYALMREFREAFGVQSTCVASAPIAAINHSKICRVFHVERLDADTVAQTVKTLAVANPDKTLVLIGNTDALVEMIADIAGKAPANVVCAAPDIDLIRTMSDKVAFAEACRRHGIDIPRTEVVGLAGDEPVPPTSIGFPLVAKPAVSADYAPYLAQGFKKVYYLASQGELDDLWSSLRNAGFDGKFLVQELIRGDDTYMDSITVYMGSDGKPRLLGAAQVLLEDHAPSMLGNPVAMITRPMEAQWARVTEMLEEVGWQGFANFDIKRDPVTGRVLFLEMNPRIGRNSYYNAAAGVNPMRVLVNDLVDHKPGRTLKADGHVLYTLVPMSLVRRYVRDPMLLREVDDLVREGAVADPQRYLSDSSPLRLFDVELTERNQVRKFARYYPEPTETSF